MRATNFFFANGHPRALRFLARSATRAVRYQRFRRAVSAEPQPARSRPSCCQEIEAAESDRKSLHADKILCPGQSDKEYSRVAARFRKAKSRSLRETESRCGETLRRHPSTTESVRRFVRRHAPARLAAHLHGFDLRRRR